MLLQDLCGVLLFVVERDIGTDFLHDLDLLGGARRCNNFDVRRENLGVLNCERADRTRTSRDEQCLNLK